jgi:hypothetical protein
MNLSDKLANFKTHPVTTVLGLVGAAATWLSLQPDLDHLTLQSAGKIGLAAAIALLGGFSAEGPK